MIYVRPVGAGFRGVGVTQGSAPLHPGLSPRAALRRGVRDECPTWRQRSCPNGANGESPGWNPGNGVRKMVRALKGHTDPAAGDNRPPRWGGVSRGVGGPRVPLRFTLGCHRAPRCGEGARDECPTWRQRSCPNGANGESPGWNPGNGVRKMVRALKGHTDPAAGDNRPPRWGGVSCGVGGTQGSAPLHPGLSPCAALRPGKSGISPRRSVRHTGWSTSPAIAGTRPGRRLADGAPAGWRCIGRPPLCGRG